jgi:hypothetical protein
VNSVDSVDNLREVVWCDHVQINKHQHIGSSTFDATLKGRTHIVIEEGKVKLLCDHCYALSLNLPLQEIRVS